MVFVKNTLFMALLNLFDKITEEIDDKKLLLVFSLICQKRLILLIMIYCSISYISYVGIISCYI